MLVQVQGLVDTEALAQAATSANLDVGFEFIASWEEEFNQKSVSHINALVCFVDSTRFRSPSYIFKWIRRVVEFHPYVPIVVVGAPAKSYRDFTVLGVDRVVHWPSDRPPESADYSRVLAETVSAIHANWLWAANSFDLPCLLVNPAGVIVWQNRVAAEDFGDSIIGEPYRVAVENGDSGALPESHPIREVLRSGTQARNTPRAGPPPLASSLQSASRYVQYFDAKGNERQAYVACMPVPSLRDTVAAVVVCLLDVTTWARVISSFRHLVSYETTEAFWDGIVEEVRHLGYSRARLYERLPEPDTHGVLVGRARLSPT